VSLPGFCATESGRQAEKTLVLFDTTRCPSCPAVRLDVLIFEQPAIIRHGGYGATMRHTIRRCRRCGWHLEAERIEVRPQKLPGSS
jgi:hypothetical protein